ncbi:MAG: hypothetical protein A3I44_02870 [Candidatus Sungbacteria bacterium RIFCSPLOWO2_02_FULL_51_17]|uniref:CAAX prenyl protease 2/Lysostaphin resistance protein A-like domain-containing protein n=1 Tax=Candidatus Sungbacteria bacterium RIFCSPHIGHO2_02_FULL_51_29 TaxID=1802273 RepID=A0A1G2KXE2_9BACT|nr:MAG: hypothetical protein A2676_00525 [Candidatus Sungbacteria bacterium RIFCSPHIGHO2_01_FULL_51_22]OHA03874.1 MAG: hypothetical protein A3C16_01155 [Candidatus Sungbacteria bacterium RIFCSPHIGHO2_02_FULL_51_29]OHA10838.1 MAG: hypothetical protein A3I44_02870 [Candidatus Sungbacteria bacterium RIFCSPLOWO2_02_FULL_51_17]
MERKSPALFAKGLVTFCLVVGPFLLIGLFLNTANVSELFTEFAHLVFGNPGAVTPVTLYWDSIPTLFIISVGGMALVSIINDITAVTIGSPKTIPEIRELLTGPPLKTLVSFVIVIVIEELVFRGFFLGVLPLLLTGTTALYLLVLASNTIFGYAHIFNYRGNTRILKFLPFFLVSFVIAFVFLKYGLVACFLVHLFHNLLATANARLYIKFFGMHPNLT